MNKWQDNLNGIEDCRVELSKVAKNVLDKVVNDIRDVGDVPVALEIISRKIGFDPNRFSGFVRNVGSLTPYEEEVEMLEWLQKNEVVDFNPANKLNYRAMKDRVNNISTVKLIAEAEMLKFRSRQTKIFEYDNETTDISQMPRGCSETVEKLVDAEDTIEESNDLIVEEQSTIFDVK